MILETIEKVKMIHERLKVVQDHLKNNADLKWYELKFETVDNTFLEVAPNEVSSDYELRINELHGLFGLWDTQEDWECGKLLVSTPVAWPCT